MMCVVGELDRFLGRKSGDADDDRNPARYLLGDELCDLATLIMGLREPLTGRAIDEETLHLSLEVPIEKSIEARPIDLTTLLEWRRNRRPIALPINGIAIHRLSLSFYLRR